MTDGVIKGSGNSRYLKSVPNALTLYPTHEAMMEAMVNGTFPIDLNGINPSGWEQVGDKLSKGTLLTDTLCSALGLDLTATPSQAMEKLRKIAATAQSYGISIETGTYTGSGNDKVLSFNSVPYLVFIYTMVLPVGYPQYRLLVVASYPQTVGFSVGSVYNVGGMSVISGAPSLTWETKKVTIGLPDYCNRDGYTYAWTMIGRPV